VTSKSAGLCSVHMETYAAFTLDGFDDQERKPEACENGFPNFKTH